MGDFNPAAGKTLLALGRLLTGVQVGTNEEPSMLESPPQLSTIAYLANTAAFSNLFIVRTVNDMQQSECTPNEK